MSVKKDKKPILVKFSIAQTTGDSNVSVYGDWNIVYITNKALNSNFRNEVFGTEKDFDLTILLDANSVTRQIDNKSVFLIDQYPTKNNIKGNYRVSKIFPEYLGLIRIGLTSVEGQPSPKLYYLDGENIYMYQLNYDSETNVAYLDKNVSHPFTSESVIWKTEPLNSEDTIDRIKFVSENNVGIVDRYKAFKELTFGEF